MEAPSWDVQGRSTKGDNLSAAAVSARNYIPIGRITQPQERAVLRTSGNSTGQFAGGEFIFHGGVEKTHRR